VNPLFDLRMSFDFMGMILSLFKLLTMQFSAL